MSIDATIASSAAGVSDLDDSTAAVLRRITERFASARDRRRLAAALRASRRRRTAPAARIAAGMPAGAFTRFA
ncbi:hypothetical protein [Demequina lignilytica]|uniref:Uncharacterized protein n=1 Tax=Demequina lignilytica TaxID=3051663 RepID=A0AB35MFL8_9MICO|nr:hypothetical protein [Demequina sp. SYSU T0a273]MDN4482536.1 hypothetical protein [Demequina sp. SYSU T0a273]